MKKHLKNLNWVKCLTIVYCRKNIIVEVNLSDIQIEQDVLDIRKIKYCNIQNVAIHMWPPFWFLKGNDNIANMNY